MDKQYQTFEDSYGSRAFDCALFLFLYALFFGCGRNFVGDQGKWLFSLPFISNEFLALLDGSYADLY